LHRAGAGGALPWSNEEAGIRLCAKVKPCDSQCISCVAPAGTPLAAPRRLRAAPRTTNGHRELPSSLHLPLHPSRAMPDLVARLPVSRPRVQRDGQPPGRGDGGMLPPPAAGGGEGPVNEERPALQAPTPGALEIARSPMAPRQVADRRQNSPSALLSPQPLPPSLSASPPSFRQTRQAAQAPLRISRRYDTLPSPDFDQTAD